MLNARTGRILPVIAILGATVALSACGGNSKTDQLKQQGAELRQDGANLQKFVAQEKADVQSGKKTQDQIDKEIEAKTDELTNKAKSTADTALDAAKSQPGVSSDVQKQLDDAKAQLDATKTK